MAKFLKVSLLLILLSTSSAYFHPTECWQYSKQLETTLFKMALEFSSLYYFMQGYSDLQLAWSIFPNWLMNCIPFIVDPDNDSYSFENVDLKKLEAAVWENEEYLKQNLRTQVEEFKSCEDAFMFFYEKIRTVKENAQVENYFGMVVAMKEIGLAGKSAGKICGESRE